MCVASALLSYCFIGNLVVISATITLVTDSPHDDVMRLVLSRLACGARVASPHVARDSYRSSAGWHSRGARAHA